MCASCSACARLTTSSLCTKSWTTPTFQKSDCRSTTTSRCSPTTTTSTPRAIHRPAEVLRPTTNSAARSLQKIYAILFDMKISKSQQLSNWDAETLTEAQTSYAAIDAWACIRIYRRLLSDAFVPGRVKNIKS